MLFISSYLLFRQPLGRQPTSNIISSRIPFSPIYCSNNRTSNCITQTRNIKLPNLHRCVESSSYRADSYLDQILCWTFKIMMAHDSTEWWHQFLRQGDVSDDTFSEEQNALFETYQLSKDQKRISIPSKQEGTSSSQT